MGLGEPTDRPLHLLALEDALRLAGISPTDTLEELREMEFLFAVDDAPAMLDFLAARMRMPVVVFDRPWNQGSPAAPERGRKILRCGSWIDILRDTKPLLLPGS